MMRTVTTLGDGGRSKGSAMVTLMVTVIAQRHFDSFLIVEKLELYNVVDKGLVMEGLYS